MRTTQRHWTTILTVPILLCSAMMLDGCDSRSAESAEASTGEPPAVTPVAHTHGAGETCYICDPAKREAGRLWCREHGRYEDRCWLCHPEMEDTSRPYCKEHFLYEDECFVCDPSLASSGGAGESPANGPHGHAADETCFICDPSKREAGRLWCAEHNRYEDRCWICQPQLEDPSRVYCEEHHLYEDECHLCNPALRGDASVPQPGGEGSAALFCKEHGVPELQCGICQPQLTTALGIGDSLLVRMPSARSAEMAGLAVERPGRGDAAASLELLGEVRYNGNRRAQVTPLTSGVLADIRVDVGEAVVAGQILAVVNSVGVARAKSEFLSALANLDVKRMAFEREERLVEENIAARRDFQEAEAAYRLAELAVRRTHQQLLNLGFTEDEIAGIRGSQSTSSDLYVRAPFDGTVVERTAVLGEAVDSGQALFGIADLSSMWIELSVPEEQAIHITQGTPIVAHVRALPQLEINGEITWISTQIDERTRMVRARATVPNDRGVLRHGMFTEVAAMLRHVGNSLLVPSESVHEINGAPFVFVREDADLFAVRRVDLGPPGVITGTVAILAGLSETDAVVTRGSFTIKSEFLKSRLGAGCVDD